MYELFVQAPDINIQLGVDYDAQLEGGKRWSDILKIKAPYSFV